jgi:hypothetical protein
MAFTAGSPELARANKLGNQLAHLFTAHGLSGAVGRTGAQMIERMAKKLGFGITGLTTGAGFPPFGTITPSLVNTTGSIASVEAALQNPRGITLPNGIQIGACEGQTIGIFMKKFVRSGADYRNILYYGLTLGATLSPGQSGISAHGLCGGITLDNLDRINFGAPFTNDDFAVVGNSRGYTLAFGFTKNIAFASPYTGATKSPGTAFNIETIGVNSYTGVANGNNPIQVAGATSEIFGRNNAVNAGFTATIYYNAPAGGSGTWSVN